MKLKIVLLLLKCVAVLPLRVLYLFSDFIFVIVYYIVGYRRKVVRRNLTESFPEKPISEIKSIEKEYYRFMCDIIVETVKLLHISDKEMKKRVTVTNPEIVNETTIQGKSAVLLMGHYGNWEWVQEISRYFLPQAVKASIYRPLNSKLWNDIYGKIRSRWNAEIIPQKSAVKALLNKENQPWVCGFIADARPRSTDASAIVRFLNHNTDFIYGPEIIGNKLGADFFFLEMLRLKRGYYSLTFHKLDDSADASQAEYPKTRHFWREFEILVKKHPSYWLWSHKRWKNRI